MREGRGQIGDEPVAVEAHRIGRVQLAGIQNRAHERRRGAAQGKQCVAQRRGLHAQAGDTRPQPRNAEELNCDPAKFRVGHVAGVSASARPSSRRAAS